MTQPRDERWLVLDVRGVRNVTRRWTILVVVLSLVGSVLAPAIPAVGVGAASPLPVGSVFVSGDITYRVTSSSSVQVGDGVGPALLFGGPVAIPATVTDTTGSTYSVTAIGDKAFESRPNSWGGYTLPSTITRIGNKAFFRDNAASSLRALPAAVESIGDDAFYGVQLTGDLVLPRSLRSVGARAYAGTAVRSITVPASLTMVGTDAFRVDATALQQVVFEGKRVPLSSTPFLPHVRIFFTVRYLDPVGGLVGEQRVENARPIPEPPPVPEVTGMVGHWVPEPGFSFAAPARDSFSATAVYGPPPVDISSCTIEPIPAQVFSGPPVEVAVMVTDREGERLEQGVDFLVSYAGNQAPGTAIVTVFGAGRYTGSRTMTFEIVLDPAVPVDIAHAVVAPIPEAAYTGEAVTPKPAVSFGATRLQAGVDYTLSYTDNVSPGTATILISGRGQYTGHARAEFVITALFKAGGVTYKVLSDAECQVGDGVNGATTLAGRISIPDTVSDRATGRSYRVTAVGERAFEGLTQVTGFTLPDTLRHVDKRAFASCPGARDIELPDGVVTIGNNAFASVPMSRIELPSALRSIGNQAFKETALTAVEFPDTLAEIGVDAFALVPSLERVVFNGKRVPYRFSSGVDVCLAVRFLGMDGDLLERMLVREGAHIQHLPELAPVSGRPGYWIAEEGYSLYLPVSDGFYAIATYPETPLTDIAGSLVDPISPQTYEGRAMKPPVTVRTPSGVPLTEGVDYAVVYERNDAPGTASAVVLGRGAYFGVLRCPFEIRLSPDFAVDISGATLSPVPDQTFTGRPLTPPVTVTLAGAELVAGVDYAVSYQNNVWLGAADVIVIGRGQYTGSVRTSFMITAVAPTPDGRINLTVLDSAIALAEAIDQARYTRASVQRMAGYLESAKALRRYIVAAGLTSVDQVQNRVDEAARMLLLGYRALEERWGPYVDIVVSANASALRAAPDLGSPVMTPLARGDELTARVDRDVQDLWWYYVEGRGYVPASDVFEYPVTGIGSAYRVVCLKAPTTTFKYPFGWARPIRTHPQGTVLTVRTVTNTWLAVTTNGPAGPEYSYVKAGDVRPVEGEYPPGDQGTNPGGTRPDTNIADPHESNPETRSPDIPGHGEGGLGPNPGGLVPIDWWPGSGTTGVDRLQRFWVKFPHNISDPDDAAVNVTRLRLYKADGTPVPARVFTRDRNLYPDSRRYIYLEPVSALDWGTRYYMEVLPGFRSRNGMVSTVTMRIPFSTEIFPFARGEGTGPAAFGREGGFEVLFGSEFGPGDGGEPEGDGGGPDDGIGGRPNAGAGMGAGGAGGTGGLRRPGPRGGLRGDREVALVMGPSPAGDQRRTSGGSSAAAVPLLGLGAVSGGAGSPGGMAPVWPGALGGAAVALALVALTHLRRRLAVRGAAHHERLK